MYLVGETLLVFYPSPPLPPLGLSTSMSEEGWEAREEDEGGMGREETAVFTIIYTSPTHAYLENAPKSERPRGPHVVRGETLPSTPPAGVIHQHV